MAAVTPVDTNPAGTLRRAAARLRSGLYAPPAGTMTATTKQAAAVGLVARLRLPLAELLDGAARRYDPHASIVATDASHERELAVALAVLGEQR